MRIWNSAGATERVPVVHDHPGMIVEHDGQPKFMQLESNDLPVSPVYPLDLCAGCNQNQTNLQFRET